MGLRPRASYNRSPLTRPSVLPSSMNKPWAGSDRYKLSGLNTVHGWTASPVHSSSLPFCVRFNVSLRGGTPYSHAATLDTGPVASGYPGGIRTRWSTNHFQSARAPPCYVTDSMFSDCDSKRVLVGTSLLLQAAATDGPCDRPTSIVFIPVQSGLTSRADSRAWRYFTPAIRAGNSNLGVRGFFLP